MLPGRGCRRHAVLTEHDLWVAGALADVATIGILHERAFRRSEVLVEQLQTALNNRITIEQAKGLLAHAGEVDMDQAWEQLRQYARTHRVRVSDIAHQLVTSQLSPDAIRHGHPEDSVVRRTRS